jgi:PAS domain S-box-containing protein
MSEPLRVLVVEDNPPDVDLIQEYMVTSGPTHFQIDCVSRLAEAIVRLERGSFDLLLIDLGLPDSRGLETFNKLRKAAPNTPIIILTGHDDEETARIAVRNGAQDYLIKGEIIGNVLVRSAKYAIERKRLQTEMQERESKLRAILDLLPVGVSVLDAKRKVSFMNSALGSVLGISEEGLLNGDYETRKYLRPDGTPMPAEEFASSRAMAEQRAVYNIETGVMKEDGAVIWTNVSAVPVDFPDWKAVIVTTDITERKQSEETLRKSEERFKLIFEYAPDAYYLNDLKGNFLDGNKAAEKTTATPPP